MLVQKQEEIQLINEKRKQCIKWFAIGAGLGIVGILLFIALPDIAFLGFISLFVGFVFIAVGATKFSKLNLEFKNKFLKELIQDVFPEANYHPKGGIDINKVYSCNFLKRADRYHTEDLIQGKFDDVEFETCDLKLEERHVRRTKNGTQVYYVTYFLGRFFEFDFPKEFKGQVITTEESLFTLFSGLKRIQLESVDYNKKFKTYTSNEHNAYYILTPHLMEAILELEKNNPGRISISFFGNRLSIAINNSKNTFELNLFKPVDERIFNELERDLLVIKNIVTELKLNRNIFA